MKRFLWILGGLLVIRLALMAIAPVFEPSEARYAAISANMARTGDFVVPRFTYDCIYQTFDGKPPLVFQACGACVLGALRLAPGDDGAGVPWVLQFAVRIFPLLSAVLLLLILHHSVRVTSEGERAGIAVVVCATCTAFYAVSGMAMTDMTLTCCVAGALLLYECFAIAVTTPARRFAYAAGVAALLGAGMIVKGPVALALFGLPVVLDAAVNRRWKCVFAWQWLAVAPIFLLIAVPWFVLVEQRNPGSVWYFFYNENFMRFVSHDYGDKYGAGREAFRGVSVLWALVATLPWVLLPLWRLRGTKLRGLLTVVKRFDVLAIVAIVGFWCLTSRVLLYYLFPMIPLFAAALAKCESPSLLRKFAPWCAAVSVTVLSVALVGGMFFSEKMQGAATPFQMNSNRYAHEFYHGTLPPQRLSEERAKLDELLREIELWKKYRK